MNIYSEIHLQLLISRRSKYKSRFDVGGTADTGRTHKGDSGTVRIILRNGQYIPAVQNLCRT